MYCGGNPAKLLVRVCVLVVFLFVRALSLLPLAAAAVLICATAGPAQFPIREDHPDRHAGSDQTKENQGCYEGLHEVMICLCQISREFVPLVSAAAVESSRR
jgi:hypothetical protein